MVELTIDIFMSSFDSFTCFGMYNISSNSTGDLQHLSTQLTSNCQVRAGYTCSMNSSIYSCYRMRRLPPLSIVPLSYSTCLCLGVIFKCMSSFLISVMLSPCTCSSVTTTSQGGYQQYI